MEEKIMKNLLEELEELSTRIWEIHKKIGNDYAKYLPIVILTSKICQNISHLIDDVLEAINQQIKDL